MSWNFETANFSVRLPVMDEDGPQLFELLKNQNAAAHIPRLAQTVDAQALDELRRMTMRFDSREAAFWLVEGRFDKKIFARIGIQHINWMMLNAQLVWELDDELTDEGVLEFVPQLLEYVFAALKLHRIEMRLRPQQERHERLLTWLGFAKEGCLPAQLEFEGESVDLEVWSLLNPTPLQDLE